MSVLEPGPASQSDATVDQPEFPVVLRGYDRQQVHTFIQVLSARIANERRRAEQAERAMAQMRLEVAAVRDQPPPSFEHLGAEAAKVLEQAGTSAKLLVEEARGRGEAVVREAEAQAADVISRAEQQAAELDAEARQMLSEAGGERDRILTAAAAEAEQLRTRAEEDARTALEEVRQETDRVRQKAISEQAALEAEGARLRESRGRMLGYLNRIHADLGALLAEASAGEPEGARWPAEREEPAAVSGEEAEGTATEEAEDADRAASGRWGSGR